MANPMMQRYNDQTGGGGRVFDVKAEVTDYDLKAGIASVRLSDHSAPVQEGFPAEIDVKISTGSPKPSRPDADFEGNAIDQRMADNIPAGDTVILEELYIKASQSGPAPVRWISSAPGANPAKVLEGQYTASGIAKTDTNGERAFEVTNIQQWSKRGMTPDEFFTDQMKANFDQGVENHLKRQNDPSVDLPVSANVGVALRAIKNNEVIDYIPPVSYNRDEKRPMSFDEVQAGYEGYKSHIEATYGEDVSVEVVPVREFPVAPSAREIMARSAAQRMVRTASPLNEVDTAPNIGNQSLSVPGVIALSPGKLNPRDGSRKGAENQWVTDAYFSARKNHIHDVIPNANGEKVEVSSVIRERMSYPARPGAEQSDEASQTQSQEAEPEPTPSADMDSGADNPDPLDEDEALLDNAFKEADQKSSGPSMG